MVVVGRAQPPPPLGTPPPAELPIHPSLPSRRPPPPHPPADPPPLPQVLTDSWGVGRIRTDCSCPPPVAGAQAKDVSARPVNRAYLVKNANANTPRARARIS